MNDFMSFIELASQNTQSFQTIAETVPLYVKVKVVNLLIKHNSTDYPLFLEAMYILTANESREKIKILSCILLDNIKISENLDAVVNRVRVWRRISGASKDEEEIAFIETVHDVLPNNVPAFKAIIIAWENITELMIKYCFREIILTDDKPLLEWFNIVTKNF